MKHWRPSFELFICLKMYQGGKRQQCLEQLGLMNVKEWLVKMVATLCTSLMVAGLWSLYLPVATSSDALNRAHRICQYDITYFDSPVYVWALRLLCLPKLMDVRFWLTSAAPQFSPETNHLKYWARLACLQLVACEFWLSTYLLSSPNDGRRKVEADDEFLMDQSQDKFCWQSSDPPAVGDLVSREAVR